MKAAGKRVLFLIAQKVFRDEEYQHPREVLENAGASITVASRTTNEAVGKLGLRVQPDIALADVKADDYDVIVFVGGGGAQEYFDDPKAHAVAREASADKILAAICIGPQTPANAGLLTGKHFTAFESQVEEIKALGGIYTGTDVARDGNIITANGPAAAYKFGEEILKALTEG